MDEQTPQNDMNTSPKMESSSKKGSKKRVIGFIAVLIIILAAGYYFIAYAPEGEGVENTTTGEVTDTTQALNEQEILAIVAAAGKHILLPTGEVPLVAPVENAAALQAEQAFYANVVNGDRVLVYQQAQRAVIYSPSRDLIVNVGPIVIEDAPAEGGATAQ